MQIKYLPLARADLVEIRQHYLDIGGKPLALRMVRGIRQEIGVLADTPYLAPPYEIAHGVRRLVVAGGAFLVFYGVTDAVEVLHVRRAECAPMTDKDFLG